MAGDKGALVFIDTTGLRRIAARLQALSPAKQEQVRKRAIASMRRGLKAETARQVSAHQLNLSARAISPYIKVKVGKAGELDYVAVYASDARLPLSAYKPRVNRQTGVTATTWRDSGQKRYPHAFKRRDGKPGIWQRIPDTAGNTRSGLVDRLPIVQRKGPSLDRALQPNRHGGDHGRAAVVSYLLDFGQQKLHVEMQRLLQYEG